MTVIDKKQDKPQITELSTVDQNCNSITIQGKSDELVKKKCIAERIPAFGLICALFSVFFGSLQSVIVKLLTDLHPIQILVIRCTFQFVVYAIVVAVKKDQIFGPKENRLYMAFRCVSATIMFTTIYVAYRLMPIADASTIHFSSPVFVIILAYFMLKEPLNIVQISTVLFTLLGVIFIAKPQFLFGSELAVVHEHRLEGTILAIIAAVMGAIGQIILRKIKSTPVAINVFWFSLTSIVTGLVILYFINALTLPTGLITWAILTVSGVLGIGDQHFFTLAFKYENAGPISVARTFNIVFTFIWGISILNEEETWSSVVGALIVLSCIVLLAFYKWKSENPILFNKIYSKITCKSKQVKLNNNLQHISPSITFSDNIPMIRYTITEKLYHYNK